MTTHHLLEECPRNAEDKRDEDMTSSIIDTINLATLAAAESATECPFPLSRAV